MRASVFFFSFKPFFCDDFLFLKEVINEEDQMKRAGQWAIEQGSLIARSLFTHFRAEEEKKTQAGWLYTGMRTYVRTQPLTTTTRRKEVQVQVQFIPIAGYA